MTDTVEDLAGEARQLADATADLVSDATVDAIQAAEAIGIPSTRELFDVGMKTIMQTPNTLRHVAHFGVESAKVMAGRSALAPDPKDWRFQDPTWQKNPVYHRLMQLYLASATEVEQLVEDADLEWRETEQAKFVSSLLVSGCAPTNFLPGNPEAMKTAVETQGRSLLRGARNFVRDVRHNGGMPLQVDRSAFVVGEDVALTPGAVVYRDEVLEFLSTHQQRPRFIPDR